MSERNRWIEACSALEIDLDAEVERTVANLNAIAETIPEDEVFVSISTCVSINDLRNVVETALLFRKVKGIALKSAMNGADTIFMAAEADSLAAALQGFVVDLADDKGLIAPLEEVNRG